MSAAKVDASCTFDYVYARQAAREPDSCAKRENASGQSHQARHPLVYSSIPKHQLQLQLQLQSQTQTQLKFQSLCPNPQSLPSVPVMMLLELAGFRLELVQIIAASDYIN